MKIEIKDITQCEKEITVTVDKDEALQEYNKVLRKFKNYVVIPGFRKGKAPLNMIERNYSEHAKEEFYNQKLGEFYKKAIDEKKQNPINQGELTDVKWEKGKELVATFKYEIMPTINVEKFKGLKVPFEETKFQKKMVDDTIEDFRQKTATEETVEKAEKGDLITAKIKFLDDEDNVTKDFQRVFALDDNSYSKTFNKNLSGCKVGDEIKTILFTNSQESEDDEIGEDIKDREFLVEIKEIKRKILPELNDDFAKDLEYDSLKDLKNKIEEELKKKLAKDNAERKQQSIATALVENNPFDVPASMVKNYAENMAKPYAEQYKIELEKITPMYEKIAEFQLKNHFIIDTLKKSQEIELTDEDKEAAIKEAAENLNMEVDKYKEMYKKQIESDDFKYALEEKKLMDMIEKSSKFVPYPKEEKKKEEK
ncbi:MAG: trigger factor [Candidatus Cloacimonetes bacterium]|nr:trigger factor [Candidatus Cloacimonadota bacterium]MCF7815311.1 trigger factor [Candidatus Cloacimonadota bacterium]MCF7869425.1 trigger factor [Candidatus Cloacimonadota bacterium]MCF7884816.1 trigger factor [Candidatus Cloacimonadota bacterium]